MDSLTSSSYVLELIFTTRPPSEKREQRQHQVGGQYVKHKNLAFLIKYVFYPKNVPGL